MTSNLEQAEALILLQGRINAMITDLAVALSSRKGVKSAARMCEVRRYKGKTVFEACVDAETAAGHAISFWFELGCESKRWHVTASVSRTVRDGQDILEQYPESLPANLNQLERAATEASDWLVNRARQFDFDALR